VRRSPAALLCPPLLAACLLGVVACHEDGGGGTPLLADAWPHDDGRGWSYETTITEYEPDTTAGADDALPTFAEAHAALEVPWDIDVVSAEATFYHLLFDGMVTTESGATGQNLEAWLDRADSGKGVERCDGERALLGRLAMVRPGLAAAGRLDKTAFASLGPLLLNGYAFAFEDTGYYGYGDLDLRHSWAYLVRSLRPGTEFVQQLVPALADDIWLHGRIWSVQDRTIGGARYRDVVECVSIVDMGLQEVVDEQGNPLGEGRSYMYGRVFYAPDVGPVAFQERSVLYSTTAYDPAATAAVRWEIAGVVPGVFLP